MTFASCTWPFQLAGLLSVVLALLAGQGAIGLALRLGWVDRPGHRKTHRRPVPYLGGPALLLALCAGAGAASWGALKCGLSGFSVASLLACILPAILASLLGLWDDLADLRARYKMSGQLALALAFSLFAYRFVAVHIPGFKAFAMGTVESVLGTAFFIVAVVNGFNMIDGSDGLCLGSSLATLSIVAAAALLQGQPHLAILAAAGAGSCLGLLFWNQAPARIYLGDSGSQALGFLVACSLVALGQSEPGQFGSALARADLLQPYHYQFVVACILAGVPALEVLLTVVRRLAQGASLARGDQGHFHHRLARNGVGRRGIMLAAVLVNLLCGLIVLAFMADEKGLAVLLAIPLTLLLGLGLDKMEYFRFFERKWLDDRRPFFTAATHFAGMQAAKLKMAQNCDEVRMLIEQACREFGVRGCRLSLRGRDAQRWSWSWTEEGHEQALHGSWSRARIPGTMNRVSWFMDAGPGKDPELSMKLRVITSEFMNQALERVSELAAREAQGAGAVSGVPDEKGAHHRSGRRQAPGPDEGLLVGLAHLMQRL